MVAIKIRSHAASHLKLSRFRKILISAKCIQEMSECTKPQLGNNYWEYPTDSKTGCISSGVSSMNVMQALPPPSFGLVILDIHSFKPR